MNSTIEEINRLEGEMKSLEDQAQQHEQASRDCRAKRAVCKQQVSEMRAIINDAKLVHAAESSLNAAITSQGIVEAMKAEATKLLEELKVKTEELEKLKASFTEKPKVTE